MTARLVALCLDALEPARLAGFWAGLLGWDQRSDVDEVFSPVDDAQVHLRFVRSGAPKLGPNRVHLHVTSASGSDQQRTVDRALRLGGSHLDVGQLPEEEHVVLADPEGNEFCVIEAGNRFLAGCGVLGELACDGTRDVGLFWSEALGWPLVWDQDQETAVQSPDGGTKVAWGGPPVAPVDDAPRQRFLLAPVDHDQRTEVDRLVSLGAARLGVAADGSAVLADVDGNRFSLLPR